MTDLLSLAEHVEAQTGPDREIDELVDIHLGHIIEAPTTPRRRANWPQRASGLSVPRYTSSLDAAMTLYVAIPERVPSDPRKATAEALRQRAEVR